jgi:serine/threonine protein kinase
LYDPNAQRGPYTDVYGLAATLYVLLTGKIPPSAMKISLGHERLIAPKKVNSNISDRLSRAIMLGMKLDPEERPQTIKEWLDLLPLPTVENESESSESEADRIAKWQAVIASKTFWATVALGVLSLVITVLVGLFPGELKETIKKPFTPSSPAPAPVELPPQN